MAKKFKVYSFAKMKPGSVEAEITEFEKAGLDVEIVEVQFKDKEDLLEQVKDADAIIGGHFFSRDFIESVPNCQIMGTYSVGYDGVDVDAASENGVLFCNNPATEWCVEEVSNQALVLLLACAKKLVIQDHLVRQGKWGEAKRALSPMGGIHDETLGLVGCGAIARLTAEKARVFKMNLIGYDPYLDEAIAAKYGIKLVSLEEVMKNSDYVSIHTPLTEGTHHLIGEEQFRMMKPTAYIINTARGPVIDEQAMIKALQEKWIAGAGLDVFEKEPVDPDNPLLKMENVILIPHSASFSDAAIHTQQFNPAREVARVLSGKWPKNPVNRDAVPKQPLKKE